MKLANFVKVNTHYTRSINLERDARDGSSKCSYIPTFRAVQTLSRLAETVHNAESPRAWALVGPYGSGKSAFGLFLSQLLSKPGSIPSKQASEFLKRSNPGLAEDISRKLERTEGYCCIHLTGSPEALSERLIKAMLIGAQTFFSGRRGPTPQIIKDLQNASENKSISTSEAIDLIYILQKSVHCSQGAGLLIIIDELGKFLEFETRHHNGNGIFLLQAIAETAYKPNSVPLHFVVLLHQAFEQYFQGLGEKLKNEWKKVQGRFESVPFVESTEQVLQILSASLTSNLDSKFNDKISDHSQLIIAALSSSGALPAGLNVSTALQLFKKCFPIHPLTLLLLPTLCQKVAQNERTLFTYLGSHEPHGFLDTLNRLEITENKLPWVMPWEIYEYFILNQPGLTTDHATHRRWAEVVTALERLGDAPIEEINLLKTIGLLNIISAQGGLKASKEILSLCNVNDEAAFRKALASLADKSIITYRKYSGEYRVWQGSDFDLEAEVQAQKAQLAGIQLAEMLNERRPLLPIVARRYGIKTGTLRYFNPIFIDKSNTAQIARAKEPTLYICLPETNEDEDIFLQHLNKLGNSLAVGVILNSITTLKESLLEVIALQRIQHSSHELASDPVAQRELKDRLSAAIKHERIAINGILEESSRSKWHWDCQHKPINNVTIQRSYP